MVRIERFERDKNTAPKGFGITGGIQRALRPKGDHPLGERHSLGPHRLRIAQTRDHRLDRVLGDENCTPIDDDHGSQPRRLVRPADRALQRTHQLPAAAATGQLSCA
jgi:hypothetical protein